MKKRIVCLLLTAVMVLLSLAACAEKDATAVKKKIGEKASEGAVTLSMYLMSEQKVSPTQQKLMEEKVNEMISDDLDKSIYLKLSYFTPDEYYTKLEADLAAMKAYYASGKFDPVGKFTYIDEDGQPKIEYPPIYEHDVDIFYFAGYDKYIKYSENGYLTSLDDQIANDSKALQAVINKTILESFYAANKDKSNKGYYAIPTNRPIGEYTYMLLNKKALQATAKSAAEINSVTDEECRDMLKLINQYHKNEFVPLYSSTGELDMTAVKNFGIDNNGVFTDSFSILAGAYDTSWTGASLGEYPIMGSVLSGKNTALNKNVDAKTQLSVLKEYEFEGYYENENNLPFAVGYIKGGINAAAEYAADYEIKLIETPVLTQADVYESMFGITTNNNNVAKSAQIVTYLNTNAEFRNLILYGVEGVNYTWVESDILDANGKPYQVVERQTEDENKAYIMDALKTGNTALAYPAVGEDPRVIEKTGEHNDALRMDISLCFNAAAELKKGTLSSEAYAALKALSAVSEDFYKKIAEAKTQDELNAVFAQIDAKLAEDAFKDITVGEKSYLECYKKWLVNTAKTLDKAENY